MLIIGITGNSGSGKTTVSTIMKSNLNALVINTDEVTKKEMVPGKDYYKDIVELFGEEIINKKSKIKKYKNRIDRPKLAEIIFSDNEKREELNLLTFKYVKKEIKRQILENKNVEYVVLDIPLLYEGKFEKVCNYVVAVVSDEETKIARICQRDNVSRDVALNRIHAQKDEEFLKEKADFVIDNSKNKRFVEILKDTLRVIHEIKDKEANK